jgi:hypothetical protein
MPRLLSNAFTRELAQLESARPLVWLFELLVPGAPVPFRVANYPEEVVFQGIVFAPFGVDVDAMEDASTQALVHLRCAFANVDQQLGSLLENYWGPDTPWTCTMWIVDVQQPNETLWSDGQVYLVAQVTISWRDAVVDLVAEGLSLSSTLPKRRYTALAGFPSMPKRIGF